MSELDSRSDSSCATSSFRTALHRCAFIAQAKVSWRDLGARPLRACWVAVVPSCPALTAILDYKQKSCSSSGHPHRAGGELLVCFYTEVTELNEDDRHQKPDRVHPQKMNFWCHKLLMILINRRTPECVFVGVPQVQSNSAHRQETHGCVIQVLIHFIQAEELPGKQLTHPSRPRSLPKFAVT